MILRKTTWVPHGAARSFVRRSITGNLSEAYDRSILMKEHDEGYACWKSYRWADSGSFRSSKVESTYSFEQGNSRLFIID